MCKTAEKIIAYVTHLDDTLQWIKNIEGNQILVSSDTKRIVAVLKTTASAGYKVSFSIESNSDLVFAEIQGAMEYGKSQAIIELTSRNLDRRQ